MSNLWLKRNRHLGCAYCKKDYTKRMLILNKLKSNPCSDCGIIYQPCQMDFDHKDPKTKYFTIGAVLRRKMSIFQAELAKCDLVCSNCHRLRTHKLVIQGVIKTGIQI